MRRSESRTFPTEPALLSASPPTLSLFEIEGEEAHSQTVRVNLEDQLPPPRSPRLEESNCACS
jgi:hypothetical protein